MTCTGQQDPRREPTLSTSICRGGSTSTGLVVVQEVCLTGHVFNYARKRSIMSAGIGREMLWFSGALVYICCCEEPWVQQMLMSPGM
jgi:hypothetical protein